MAVKTQSMWNGKDGKDRTGPLILRPSPSLTLLLSVLAHVHVTVDVT